MSVIHGIVTSIKYKNKETNRFMADIRYETPDGISRATLGCNVFLNVGDAFKAEGDMKENNYRGRAGWLFNAKTVSIEPPKTMEGMKVWLDILFDDPRCCVTNTSIKSFLDTYGVAGINRAISNPEFIYHLVDNPRRRPAFLLETWKARISRQRAMKLLEKAGIEEKAIKKIVKRWQDRSYEVLNENPYRIATIPSVGFKPADKFGQYMGVGTMDVRRLSALTMEALKEVVEQGSTTIPVKDLIERVSRLSGIPMPDIRDFMARMSQRGGDKDQKFSVFLDIKGVLVCGPTHLVEAEIRISKKIISMIATGHANDPKKVREIAQRYFAMPEYKKFDSVQRLAVEMAACEPISIITGGPGTGKSTVADVLVKICEELSGGPSLLLASPTGKAAKRLSETTKRKATTVHRLLRANGNEEFLINASNPLPAGSVVFLDETSMTDVELMDALLEALPADGRIVLLGDAEQLPSVGPGEVLEDMLQANRDGERIIPSITLVNVYRTSKDSEIAKGAAKVCNGEMPEFFEENHGGVSFQEMSDRRIIDEIIHLVCEVAPQQGLDPLRDVAVLCPQTTGPVGTWAVNKILSQKLNPNGKPIPGLVTSKDDNPLMPIPRIGDRVMQTKNESLNDIDIINGDLGLIVSAEKSSGGRQMIQVKWDDTDTIMSYPVSKWRNLILAYAGTTHKSQGSQYKTVIMPISASYGENMMYRRLVYTGWTRAQNRLHLLGDKEVFRTAIRNRQATPRLTMLKSYISSSGKVVTNRPNWHALYREAQKEFITKDNTENKRQKPHSPSSTMSAAIVDTEKWNDDLHDYLESTPPRQPQRSVSFGPFGRRKKNIVVEYQYDVNSAELENEHSISPEEVHRIRMSFSPFRRNIRPPTAQVRHQDPSYDDDYMDYYHEKDFDEEMDEATFEKDSVFYEEMEEDFQLADLSETWVYDTFGAEVDCDVEPYQPTGPRQTVSGFKRRQKYIQTLKEEEATPTPKL